MATIDKNFVVKNGIDVGQNATVTGSLTASGLSYPVSDGIAGDAIVTDGAGNLSFTTIDTVHSTATNQTGSLIPKGSPVYQSGTAGQTIEIDLADNSSPSTMPAIGVASEDIANGDTGEVIHFGFIKGVDTSAFSEGDVIYVGTSGSYTNVRPTGEGNLVQNLGRVLKVHASNGSGVVMGAGRANDVSNLNDGNIFIGNSTNVAETATLDTLLVPENTNLYFTTQRAVDAVESHPHLTIDGGTLYVDTDNNYVGINDTSPSHSLDVTGAIAVAGTAVIDSGSEVITSQLKDSGVTSGSYGSASLVPIITIDAKGRITAASTTSVAGVSNFTFNNVTDVLTIDTADGNSFTSDISNITVGGSLVGPLANLKVQYGANYSGTPIQGSFFFDSLNQKLKVYTGTEFVDAVPGGDGGGGGGDTTDAVATVEKYTYTISSTTNALSGGDDNGDTLGYVVDGSQNVELFVNGIKQVEGSSNDYVATTGTSVTLTYNLAAGDVVDVMVYELLTQDAFYLKTQTYTQTEVNSQISTAVADYLPLTGGTLTGGLTGTSGTFSSDFTVDTNTFHVDTTNNRVGIGTTSPTLALDIRTQAVVGNGTDGVKLTYSSGNSTGIIDTGFSSTGLEFRTGNTFAGKIDSAGNLLFGKDVTTYTTEGFNYERGGALELTRDSGRVLRVHRTTSDGTLVEFNKTSTLVGSINTEGNDLAIGNGDAGLQFIDGTQSIRPFNVTTNARIDAQVNLGMSTTRFKDLYLSGGVLDGTTTGYSFISGGNATNNGSNIFVYGGSNASNANTTIFRNGSSETMRIDSSGNVGIGTDNPNSILHVKSPAFTDSTIHIDATSTNVSQRLDFRAGGTLSSRIYDDAQSFQVNAVGNKPLILKTNDTERMRINSSGGVGINTNAAIEYMFDVGRDDLAYTAGKTMRINSSGDTIFSLSRQGTSLMSFRNDNNGYTCISSNNGAKLMLGYGTADAGAINNHLYFTAGETIINGAGQDRNFRVECPGEAYAIFLDSGDQRLFFGNSSTAENTSESVYIDVEPNNRHMFIAGNSREVLYVNRNGTSGTAQVFRANNVQVGGVAVNSSGTTYNTTSDRRLKDNIVTITDGKEKLLAMNPVTHTWKADPEADAVHGFVAQEMQEVVPEAVSGEPDGDDMMSMDYGRITPVIVAALQDALKEIEELKTRINKLESK